MKIKVQKLHPNAKVPRRATKGSACFDLFAIEPFVINPGQFVKIRTGIALEIPRGYFVEIVPRSGMAFRGISIVNSPGTIDSDYRGEITVGLYGLFCKQELFNQGSRIAQARLVRTEWVNFEVVDKLSDTDRGVGGFGSTGK